MNYELDYFEQILNLVNEGIAIKPTEIDIESEMSGELYRIKQRIDTYIPLHDMPLKAYINYQLSSFERFKMKISQISVSPLKQIDKEILKQLEMAMDELIDHIYHYYPNEFNPNTKATPLHLQDYQQQYELQETALFKTLETHQIDPKLKTIVETILMNNPGQHPSYSEIDLKKKLLDHLPLIPQGSDLSNQIAMLLIALRYNHHDLYDYHLETLHQRQQKAISAAEQFRDLILYRKELDQLMELRENDFFIQNPNLKSILLKGTDAEINFLKDLDFLNTELIHSGILDSSYKVGLSVRQLAFYIFLNVECGVITERKAKTVHQYIVANVSSKEAEQISEKSFSNAYYVHHPEDIRKVSEFLAKMLAMAQKLY